MLCHGNLFCCVLFFFKDDVCQVVDYITCQCYLSKYFMNY